jgi:hypothetical protein
LDDDGHLVVVPDDARLRVCGLDSSLLPAGLLDAGRRLLDLTLPTSTAGDEQ